jgi:hypothetical protein
VAGDVKIHAKLGENMYKKEYFEQFGRAITNFQMLEQLIELFAWSLIGKEQAVGQIVTSQLSFQRLCDLSCALFKYKCDEQDDKDIITELDALFGKISEIENERNKFVHSKWYIDVTDFPSTSLARFKTTANKKRGLQHHTENVTLDDIKNYGQKIAEIYEELNSFMWNMNDLGFIELPKRSSEDSDEMTGD